MSYFYFVLVQFCFHRFQALNSIEFLPIQFGSSGEVTSSDWEELGFLKVGRSYYPSIGIVSSKLVIVGGKPDLALNSANESSLSLPTTANLTARTTASTAARTTARTTTRTTASTTARTTTRTIASTTARTTTRTTSSTTAKTTTNRTKSIYQALLNPDFKATLAHYLNTRAATSTAESTISSSSTTTTVKTTGKNLREKNNSTFFNNTHHEPLEGAESIPIQSNECE